MQCTSLNEADGGEDTTSHIAMSTIFCGNFFTASLCQRGMNPINERKFCAVSIWKFRSFQYEFPSLEKRGQGRFFEFAIKSRKNFHSSPFGKGGKRGILRKWRPADAV